MVTKQKALSLCLTMVSHMLVQRTTAPGNSDLHEAPRLHEQFRHVAFDRTLADDMRT